MRDNFDKPGIIYSPKTEIRPYLNGNLNFQRMRSLQI